MSFVYGVPGRIRTFSSRVGGCRAAVDTTDTYVVLPLGFEPRSSPHLEASPRYKLGALTVKLWEQKLGAGRENRTLTLSLARTKATFTSYPPVFVIHSCGIFL